MDKITADDLKWLLDLLRREQLAEIEVGIGEDRVILKAAAPGRTPAPATVGDRGRTPSAQPAAAAAAAPESGEVLRSPMAGIFYRRPSPEAKHYVEPGDEVHIGDTIGLIEAMKLYNEVTSHVHGRVVRFLAEEERHVEADQPLVLIEPV